jgi:hypothetical protein
MSKKLYTRKTTSGGRSSQPYYTWSPTINMSKTNLGHDNILTGCDNKKNVDYNVDYTYNIELVNNIATHVPYVQCGYVE